MARTFLELVQQAAGEIGIPVPTSLIGNTNDQEIQLVALSNREGKEFSSVANKNGGWQNLHKEYTFNTAILTTTGDTTSGSAIITNIPSTTGLVAGTWALSANGFQVNTMIASVDSSTQVTLTYPCDETQVGVELNFAQVAYDLPSDLEYFLDKTYWDDKYKWALVGPITAQEKQILRYGVLASGPRNKFYIRRNKMWLDPLPSDVELIAYDYYSNNWCESAAGVGQKTWQADTDLYLLDEDTFINGLKWRFLRAKGFDYSEEFSAYEMDVQRSISRDGGTRDLALGGVGYSTILLSNANIPDTGFGGV
jgi:hypothetical protein